MSSDEAVSLAIILLIVVPCVLVLAFAVWDMLGGGCPHCGGDVDEGESKCWMCRGNDD